MRHRSIGAYKSHKNLPDNNLYIESTNAGTLN